jgi:hypothetical protein
MVTSSHLIVRCIESPLLKKSLKSRKEEEEDVSSYWMILRKREDTGI